MSHLGRRHLPLLLILLLATAALGRAVGFPFVNWDDPKNVVDNPLTANPLAGGVETLLLTPEQGYPMPVTILSHALERALFGPGPVSPHVVNLLLHLCVVVLAYTLFLRLGAGEGAASKAVLLVALHPLVVEPVCWVTGRKDLLATALLLAALVVAAGPRPRAQEARPPAGVLRWLASQLLALLALLAKPSAVVAPLALGLVAWRCRQPGLRRLALILLPLTLAAGVLAYVGVVGERAVGALPGRGAGQAVGDVLGALALQLKHLVWPTELLAAYYRAPGDPPAWMMVLAVAAALGLGLAVWRLCTSGESCRMARLGLLLALLAYLPASNILGIARWVADSYMYLPLVFLGLGLVSLGQQVWPARISRIAPGLWVALAAALALLSFVQTDSWSSSTRLWAPVARRYPDDPRPLTLLALGKLHDGDERGAARTLVELRQRFPGHDHVICDQAWAFARLGLQGEAEALLVRGVRLGRAECAQRYVLWLLAGHVSPSTARREAVRQAFEQILPEMELHVKDRRTFARAAEILGTLGLGNLAERAARRAGER